MAFFHRDRFRIDGQIRIFREDPIYVKFMEEVIKPNMAETLALDFEMDPGKDSSFHLRTEPL